MSSGRGQYTTGPSHAADTFGYLAMTIDRHIGATGFNRRLEFPWLGLA
jgi:hypothetical protein